MSNVELVIEEIKTLPASRVEQVLDFVEFIKQKEIGKAEGGDSWFEKGEGCPICAKYRDPVTGVPNYKPEVFAGMQEVEDMISGKIPVKWHASLDDLDEMLGL
jgi:hypothetical protein